MTRLKGVNQERENKDNNAIESKFLTNYFLQNIISRRLFLNHQPF